jgi:short-subunit dehydrogenase
MLRDAGGRIINVSSVQGFLAWPLQGTYAASKHALEAVSDCLRREVATSGVLVSIIEPGNVSTPIWSKALDCVNERMNQIEGAQRERYGPAFAAAAEQLQSAAENGVTADQVAQRIERALLAARPRARYRVGRDAHLAYLVARLLPDALLDRLILSKSG